MRRKLIAPIGTLLIIALIVFMVFSITYQVTESTIQSNAEQAAAKVRMEVLPDSTDFLKVEDIEYVDNVTEVYASTDGNGYAITSEIETDAGNITVVTGITILGEVTGIKITDAGDGATINDVLKYSDVYIDALKSTYGSSSRIVSLLSEISADAYSPSDILSAVSAANMQIEHIGGEF